MYDTNISLLSIYTNKLKEILEKSQYTNIVDDKKYLSNLFKSLQKEYITDHEKIFIVRSTLIYSNIRYKIF